MTTNPIDPKKSCAAQNAREGLINVADLSVLTGIATPQLTKFAKGGLLNHYGEYHGKRFYNFQEVVKWATETETDDEAKTAIRNGMEAETRVSDCPYALEKVSTEPGEAPSVKIVWKDLAEAA
jgi:hypothetical protein